MSGKLVGEVLNHAPADLTSAQMLVLISLAESARDSDRTAHYHCSLKELEERTRLARPTIKNTLGQLKKRGLIRPVIGQVVKGTKHQEYALANLSTSHRFATITGPDTEEKYL